MLQRLGRVLHTTHNGYIVATLETGEKLPPLNTPVYDEKTNRVGVLLDIIGPVKSPYAVIKPDRRDIRVEEGATLYYRPPRPPRGRGQRRGRQRGKPREQRGAQQGRRPRGRGAPGRRGGPGPRRGPRRGGGGGKH